MTSENKIYVDSEAPAIAQQVLGKAEALRVVELTPKGIGEGPAASYVTTLKGVTHSASNTYRSLHWNVLANLEAVKDALESLLSTDEGLAVEVKKAIATLESLDIPEAPAAASPEPRTDDGRGAHHWDV